MSDASEILKSVHIGLDVAIFLLNTDRGSQAIKLCEECAILIQNLDSGIHLDTSDALFNAHYAITACIKCAERNAKKLLCKFHLAGRLTMQLGDKYKAQTRFVEAKQLFKSVLTIRQMICCMRIELVAHGRLGHVCLSLGEIQNAKKYYQKALAIAIEIGDREEESTTYRNLGVAFFSLGEYQTAKKYAEKALAIAIEIGDREGEKSAYRDLGCVFHSLGKYQKAKEYLEKALAIAIETGDREEEGGAYRNLGAVFSSLGEYQKAIVYQKKALAIAIEIGHREEEGVGYCGIGIDYARLRKSWQAKQCLDKAVGVSIAIGSRELEARATAALAGVCNDVNDFQKAKEHCEKALTISRECGYRDLEAATYITLGNTYHFLGKCGEAEDCLEKACIISSQIGNKMMEFESLLSIIQFKLTHSEVAKAKHYLIHCIEKYEQIRAFLKGNSEFKMSLLEVHGTSPYQLLSRLLCETEKLQDALYVEELGRARVLAELMADKYSVQSHISANPHSWVGIENIVKRESNSDFLKEEFKGDNKEAKKGTE
ncbi:tetratricopeptide repeat protein 28-like [Stylophora pistillata]|uniref:tetratricopeptide repeat protein 28-like n=1 Tax=Stylophora pistillata TaxID=50429 RepID=UPI000C0420D1|nr:tetratricopeptide repeat protein 28-like [Stylophora pistillata]